MPLFDITSPRAFAWQSMKNARVPVMRIVRVAVVGDKPDSEIEVLYVTPEQQAHIAYIRADGKIAGHGLPW